MNPGAMYGAPAPFEAEALLPVSMLMAVMRSSNSMTPATGPFSSSSVPRSRLTARRLPRIRERGRASYGGQMSDEVRPCARPCASYDTSQEKEWLMDNSSFYPEPPISKFLFASRGMAPLWTVIRVYLGWLWLDAGWHKVTNPAWVGEN